MFVGLHVCVGVCMSVCLSQLLCVSVRVFVYTRYSFVVAPAVEVWSAIQVDVLEVRTVNVQNDQATSSFC